MQLQDGSRLGPYEILALIGSGGMGEVYRARDVRLEREVAVKILSKRLGSDPDALERFEREAKAVAALSHPNIVAIHDFAVQDGMPYTVTELLDGESLRQRLARGPVPWREAAEIAIATAYGLSAAHAKGIVHRDLKPENLFLTREGRVKILDFGLARTVHEAWTASRADDPSAVTMATPSDSGTILGTVGYMSPEQARGLPLGTTSDIFSLGCVLYELVTGRRAFDGPTPTDALAAVLQRAPADISESGRHVPHELSRIVQHCLEKNPSLRFQSARDVAFALQAVLNDSGLQVAAGRARGGRTKAVAVLPFTIESGEADLDYLSDGLTESLINSLSRVPRLRVIPRTVVFRYKGRTVEPRTVGVELNATTLVTGRVVAHGGTLNVQTELTDVLSEAQLWGHRFVRPLSDLFAVQEELAEEIADALRGRLSRRGPKARRGRPKPDSAAYEDFLRGRYYWNRWKPLDFAKAVQYFEAAIAKDAGFAPAWAGLADALGASGYFGFVPAAEAMPRAMEAAERAIALDPELADGHAALALGLLFWRFDFAGAERALDRAIALNPRSPLPRVYSALHLLTQGRFDEALAAAREAERLDPVAPITLSSVIWVQLFAGRLHEAEVQVHRLLDLDPQSPDGQGMLIGIHEARGEYAAAIRRFEPFLNAVGQPPALADDLRERFEREGPPGYWKARLDILDRLCQCGGPQQWAQVDVCVRMGKHERALDLIEQAHRDGLGALAFLAADPHLTPLHGHPRFEALRIRLGLPRVERQNPPSISR